MRRYLPLIGGAALCGWIALRGLQPNHAPKAPEPPPTSASSPLPRSYSRLTGEWQELVALCEKDGDPVTLGKRLAATKERWLLEDPQILAGVIGQLLSQGDDAVTGIEP